jgi:two-component system sensor histidine kinase YesM
VENHEENIEIRIRDNGTGMEKETLDRICAGGQAAEGTDSTGIGIHNVISRLELYYNAYGIFHICSEGKDKGTTVVLRIPKRGGDVHVSNTGS